MTTALLLAAGLLAAGCGGGGGDGDDGVASIDGAGADSGEQADGAGDGDAEDPDAELMEWVECMRDEGVPIDDPVRDENGNVSISGPGIHIGSGAGGGGPTGGAPEEGAEGDRQDREAMDAAMEACGPPAIVNENRGEVDEEEMQETMLAFAECMRSEGVEDFPDPDFSDAGPGGAPQENSSDGAPGGGGGAPERQVVIGPFGEIDLDDPTTAAAFEACQDTLGAPGGDGGATGTSDT